MNDPRLRRQRRECDGGLGGGEVEHAAAPVGALVAGFAVVLHVAEVVAAEALRHGDAEVRRDADEGPAQVLFGVSVDVDTLHQREARAAAQVAPKPRESRAERRQHEVLRRDVAEGQTECRYLRAGPLQFLEFRSAEPECPVPIRAVVGRMPGHRADHGRQRKGSDRGLAHLGLRIGRTPVVRVPENRIRNPGVQRQARRRLRPVSTRERDATTARRGRPRAVDVRISRMTRSPAGGHRIARAAGAPEGPCGAAIRRDRRRPQELPAVPAGACEP